MNDCLGTYMDGYRNAVKAKSDQELLYNVQGLMNDGKNTWYDESKAIYRAYMRLVKQELHRRGLGS